MAESDDTTRTKAAVQRWCGRPLSEVELDAKLEDLRSGAYSQLREFVNYDFKSTEGRFPIFAPEWHALDAKTVRQVRDEVVRRKQ